MNNPRVDAPWRRPSLVVICLLAIGIAIVAIGIAPTTASAVPNPTVTGPVTAACSPICPSPPGPANGIHIPDAFDGGSNLQEFIDDDYTEEEFYFEGTATAFERDPTAPAWDSTGFWTARPSTTLAPAAYKSRMLVDRPTDPTKFNGIVVVEWFNVTAIIDLGPDYGYFRKELRRDGFIWVGVTAQFVGVNGSSALPGFALKAWDPVRYGSLLHPGDNYSYDILSQAGQAIRSPVGVNPLGSSDYVITGMIADGESQSAGRMTTYVDAIAPLAQVFDGYLIHSRGAAGAGLFGSQCTGGSNAGGACATSGQCPGGACTVVAGGAVPSPSKIRTDIPPVLVFETETDTAGHFAARQPDGPNYRLWEPAGTAHVDDYDFTFFNLNNATTEPFYPTQSCAFPKNMANERYVMNSAILHLGQWINGGTPPPNAPSPINVVGGVIQRDQYNIATGGIRLPEMDVPTQTHQGTGNTGTSFCILFGRTFPLSRCAGGTNDGAKCVVNSECPGGSCAAIPLSSLYNTHSDYVSAYTAATNNLETAGFILPPDAAETIAAAQSSTVGIRCGNGAGEAGEGCDDGNTIAGDGCSDTCTVETGYFCTGSPSMCAPICGDNLVTGPEQCDDGNTTAGDGCSATCTVEPGFACMGNPSTCQAICGDGLVVDGEGCDDGSVAAGDGCSPACTVEVGWSCSGEPSMCAPICGDGLILGTETCDDGVANGTLASCCSTSCQFQSGGTPCDDGNACTTSDTCTGMADSCAGGPPTNCNDGNVCTADSCNPPSGCIHDGPARDGFACDDGDACTQGDVCSGGQCMRGPAGADSDGDGYCDAVEVAHGCNPNDSNEIPPQPAAFAGSPVGGVGNFLVTYLVPANRKVSKATDPSCASAGVCAGTGFCSAGKIADPCATNGDCNEPANTCRVVANYAAIPDLAVRRPFMLNRTALSSFEPLTPGCSRKVDVTLDPARSSNVLKINVTGTVSGHVRRDADRFTYR